MFYLIIVSASLIIGFVVLAQLMFHWLNKLAKQTGLRSDHRQVSAFTDLGEPNPGKTGLAMKTSRLLPSNQANALQRLFLKGRHSFKDKLQHFIHQHDIKNAVDYIREKAHLLKEDDYTLSPETGVLSLNFALQQDEMLAVAYSYTAGFETFQVGEFSDKEEDGQPMILKLLHGQPTKPMPNDLMVSREAYFQMDAQKEIVRYKERQHFYLSRYFKDHSPEEIKINRLEVWKIKKAAPFWLMKKNPAADIFRYRGLILRMSLLFSTALMTLAFSWPVYMTPPVGPPDDPLLPPETLVSDPIPPHPKDPPPPPEPVKPPVKDPVAPVFKPVDKPLPPKPDPQPEPDPDPPLNNPGPKPPPEPDTDTDIFKIVEEMPEFPGGEPTMMKFIYKHIVYPGIAVEGNVEGKVFVTFVVEKDGSLTDFKVIRDIGAGCGNEVIRVLNLMPKWKPGKQRGEPVRVQFVIPVNFELD